MRVFVLILIVVFNLTWITNAEDLDNFLNNATFVQGIIAIKPRSKYQYIVTEPVKYHLQNIGEVKVIVKKEKYFKSILLQPCQKIRLTFTLWWRLLGSNSFIISNQDSKERAIIYISNFNKNYVQEPENNTDTTKILKKTFNIGIKNISECETLDKLISYFWYANGTNVWKQIFGVIKGLLNVDEQNTISNWIESDIKDVKMHLDGMNNMINDAYIYDREEMISKIKIIAEWRNIVHPFLSSNIKFHFYVLPLFSNFISLKMYLFRLADVNRIMLSYYPSMHNRLEKYTMEILNNFNLGANRYIKTSMSEIMNELYNTVYAPGLYNIIMNARSYLALHGLEFIPLWKQIQYKICGVYNDSISNSNRLMAISYSNYYGRPTPNLLQQAIHIKKSSLSVEAELETIFFNFEKGTVCGLELNFHSNHSYTMGIFKTAKHKKEWKLDLSESKIFQLKVYKTKFIRCLEFTLSNGNTRMYGDCQPNSEKYKEFQLKDHYINSLYLANDYSKTYFDNVAVSYLPNPVNVF